MPAADVERAMLTQIREYEPFSRMFLLFTDKTVPEVEFAGSMANLQFRVTRTRPFFRHAPTTWVEGTVTPESNGSRVSLVIDVPMIEILYPIVIWAVFLFVSPWLSLIALASWITWGLIALNIEWNSLVEAVKRVVRAQKTSDGSVRGTV